MKDLIEALQIFLKYKEVAYPTHCEHDVLWVVGYSEEEISDEDKYRLRGLGFIWSDSHDSWISYRFGSA